MDDLLFLYFKTISDLVTIILEYDLDKIDVGEEDIANAMETCIDLKDISHCDIFIQILYTIISNLGSDEDIVFARDSLFTVRSIRSVVEAPDDFREIITKTN